MPEFYNSDFGDVYADDTFEIEEPMPEESLEVFEEEQSPETDMLEVSEPDEDLMVEEERVPGTDVPFAQYSKDEPEKKETNWENDKDPSKFIDYIKVKLTQIPRWSGKTIPGAERAISYLKSLENEASKAMRSDFNGVIDEEELDKIRKDVDNMIFRLENHIERLEKGASQQRVRFISQGECSKCGSNAPMWIKPDTNEQVCMSCDTPNGSIEKTAGTPTVNVFMTPFERSIVSTAINATVSGGKNINEVFAGLDKKYKFSDRERLAFTQLLADYGYPLYLDRGRVGDKDKHPSDGEGVDWQTNYPG